MKKLENIPKIATAVLLFALLLRMVIGIAVPAASMFRTPEADRMLIYGQADRLVRAPAGRGNGTMLKPSRPAVPESSETADSSAGSTLTSQTEKPTVPTTVPTTAPTAKPTVPTTQATVPTTQPAPTESFDPRPDLPSFTAADVSYTNIYPMTGCIYSFNQSTRATLLQKRLSLDLDNGQPTVLIIHTHGTECYKGDHNTSYSYYRNPDTSVNMISIGAALKDALEAAGIQVIHDTELHDYYNYDGAYDSSREAIAAYLEEYPSIQLVLDVHRDSFENGKGTTAVTLNGEKVAQPMLYVGTDSKYTYHTAWRESMSLAMKMQVLMEKQTPGLMRNIMVSNGVYNQDLCAPSLLVEIGAAGDTHAEALRAVPYVAQAIIALANGAN